MKKRSKMLNKSKNNQNVKILKKNGPKQSKAKLIKKSQKLVKIIKNHQK
jgi:hypothetical protein